MQNRVGLITGRRGAGKTTVAKEIARYEPRLFVFDPNGEYSDLVRDTVTDGEELSDFMDEISDRDQNEFAVRWLPEYDPVEDSEFYFAEVFEEAKSRGDGVTLLIDESHLLFPSAAHTPPELGRVLRLGRHAPLNVLIVSPRIVEISRCASFQADFLIVCGAISEPADLKALEERTSEDFRRQVEGLGRYGQACWDAIEREEVELNERTLSHLLESDSSDDSYKSNRVWVS